VIAVALEGLDNSFKVGKENFLDPDTGDNKFTLLFETYGYLDDLEEL